ncbi:MAG: hypothetical protein LPJ95_10295 [Paracoccaceae bacterium]|nr:hypothetical protein [Paracoccaceae bacterium]
MAGAELTQTRLAQGIWEGMLTGAGAAPRVEALHDGLALPGVEVVALPQGHAVRVPLPGWILSDGVQVVLVQVGGEVLSRITLIAGAPPDEDLRAEVSQLRAELDLLKRAYRRHCAETAE